MFTYVSVPSPVMVKIPNSMLAPNPVLYIFFIMDQGLVTLGIFEIFSSQYCSMMGYIWQPSRQILHDYVIVVS